VGRAGSGRARLARILRGEVYWADLNPVRGREQAGLGPVLILSHDLFNKKSGTVIAMTESSIVAASANPAVTGPPAAG
jgi:mRNA-degrading endonuclease toxin of MazEF toxin-antitoxin module